MDLGQARRRAKELVRSGQAAKLAQAQLTVARELGFSSWPALIRHVEDRFVHAALSGDIATAERYLEQRPELAEVVEVALLIGNERPVREALKDPGWVNRLLTHGHKPFELPIFSPWRNTDRAPALRRLTALLLDHGAKLPGAELLTFSLDDLETVRVLLDHGDLTPEHPELRDALIHARDPDVAELLIERGASVEARDEDGLTPYSRAARFRSRATMDVLARHGGATAPDPAAAWIGAVLRGEPAGPKPPLRWADEEQLPRWASAGEDELVKRLIEAGVPVDATGVEGGSALHYAAVWGRASTCALLLEHGADLEFDADGPPLQWLCWGSLNQPGAAGRDYAGTARVLLRAGARDGGWEASSAVERALGRGVGGEEGLQGEL